MPEPLAMRLSYRSVFLSDLHLGSVGCHTERLSAFLGGLECENLYLVGDLLDFWVGTHTRKWKQAHTDILRRILAMANTGTIVRYTPGNHDALCRKLCGAVLGNILVDHRFVHTTADGRRLLVVHGDVYDRIVSVFRPIAWIGSWCYEILTVMGAWLPAIVGGRLAGKASLADRARQKVKSAFLYITNFEERITVDARLQGYDGVVCGHVHRPELSEHWIGAVYANAGDWQSHCTAIVEHWDGSLELVRWEDLVRRSEAPDDAGRWQLQNLNRD